MSLIQATEPLRLHDILQCLNRSSPRACECRINYAQYTQTSITRTGESDEFSIMRLEEDLDSVQGRDRGFCLVQRPCESISEYI